MLIKIFIYILFIYIIFLFILYPFITYYLFNFLFYLIYLFTDVKSKLVDFTLTNELIVSQNKIIYCSTLTVSTSIEHKMKT